MHSGRLVDNRGRMASARIKLDPQATEAIARKVVELLEKRDLQRRDLVDAAELAKRFGIERSWVYSHAIELGAVSGRVSLQWVEGTECNCFRSTGRGRTSRRLRLR